MIDGYLAKDTADVPECQMYTYNYVILVPGLIYIFLIKMNRFSTTW